MASPPRLGSSGVKGAAGASRSEGTVDSRGDQAPLFAVKSQIQEPEGLRVYRRPCMSAVRSFWTARQSVLHKARHLGLGRGGSRPAEPYETVTNSASWEAKHAKPAPPEWASQLEQPTSRVTQETLRGSQKARWLSEQLGEAGRGRLGLAG